jgi:hypothetical protein
MWLYSERRLPPQKGKKGGAGGSRWSPASKPSARPWDFRSREGQADRGPGEGVTSASVLTQVPCSLGHYREFLLIGLSRELSALIRQSSLSRHFVVKREVAAQWSSHLLSRE